MVQGKPTLSAHNLALKSYTWLHLNASIMLCNANVIINNEHLLCLMQIDLQKINEQSIFHCVDILLSKKAVPEILCIKIPLYPSTRNVYILLLGTLH
jgi:hypothetical protein